MGVTKRSRNYNGLTDREIAVLVCRFLWDMTLEATSKEIMNTHTKQMGVTKERVRQMEFRALRKLRRKPEEIW